MELVFCLYSLSFWEKKTLLTQQIRMCVYANLPVLQYFCNRFLFFRLVTYWGQFNFCISTLQVHVKMLKTRNFVSFKKRYALI